MVAVAHRDADKFASGNLDAFDVFLIFGPDVGLVSERSSTILKRCGLDPANPDQIIRVDGDDLATTPGKLYEEVHGMGLFANKRGLLVRAGGKQFQSSVEAIIESPSSDCKVIIQAGALRRDAPLRVLATRARNAAAIECYADTAKDLERLVDLEMKSNGISISPDARAALIALLGDDRLSTRNELEKLILYTHGKAQITEEDIVAAVADASAFAMDSVISSAFSGDFEFVGDESTRLYTSANEIPALLAAATRHAHTLLQMRIEIDRGASVESVIDRYASRAIFGARRDALQRQATIWRLEPLLASIAALNRATLESRVSQDLSVSIAMDSMLLIARRFRMLQSAMRTR